MDQMITFVIPMYNEEGSLALLYEKIIQNTANKYKYEIIFVDDGSTDGSVTVIRKIIEDDPNVHLIVFRKNFGKAAALQAGFRNSKGDITVSYTHLIGCFLMYIMITPVSWGDILGIIEKTIKMFSNYTYWVNTNFYFGENINATQLPWHYLPVWIWISTPLVYTMFFVSGFCGSIARITKRLAARKKFVSQDWNTAFTLLIITVPILYVWITRPVLYTGWRHFYFIYPSIILIAVIAVSYTHLDVYKRQFLYLPLLRHWDWSM